MNGERDGLLYPCYHFIAGREERKHHAEVGEE